MFQVPDRDYKLEKKEESKTTFQQQPTIIMRNDTAIDTFIAILLDRQDKVEQLYYGKVDDNKVVKI